MLRRKFIYIFTFGSIGFLSINSIFGSKATRLKSLLTKEQKNIIIKYNSDRKNKLKINIKEEIKKDLQKNRTIWMGRRLYTFAELKDL